MSETITFRGENIMKKVVTTLTALTFALGLAASGYAQPPVKKEEKPVVQTQTTTAGSQVNPAEADKGKEAAKTAAKQVEKDKGKKSETMTSKKDVGKKPEPKALETKKEEKPDLK